MGSDGLAAGSWHSRRIYASPQKAVFIIDVLPTLVKLTAFCIDTPPVNQKDPAEVIAVVQRIPDIFRKATETIAGRESDGLYACCAEATQNASDWQDFTRRLGLHSINPIHKLHAR